MPFQKKFKKISKKISKKSLKRLLPNTLLLSLAVFIFGSLYLYARRGNFDLYIANKVFATTALVLIGLSFALSGLCYFWDFIDTKIVYRKHLGLVGLVYGVVHILVTLFLLPHKFAFPGWIETHGVSFWSAIGALIIFTIMAAISNRYSVRKLGGKNWRLALRVGYVAYLFIIIHFTLLKYEGWMKWFDTKDPFLPPLSMLEIVFAILVILLRIALYIDVKRKSQLKA